MDSQIYKNIIRIDFYNMEYLVVYFLSPTKSNQTYFHFMSVFLAT